MSNYTTVPVTPPAMNKMEFKNCEFPPEVRIERSFDQNTLEMNNVKIQSYRDTSEGKEMFSRPVNVSSYAARGVFQSNGSSIVNNNNQRSLSRNGSEASFTNTKEFKTLSRASSSSSLARSKQYKFPLKAYSIQPYGTAYAKEEEQRIIDYFTRVFKDLDDDMSGEITKKEFHSAFKRPDMQREFQKLGFQFHESPKLFKYLNKDLGPTLDIYEFVDGLREIVDQNNKNGTPGRIVQPRYPGGPAPRCHVFRNCYKCDSDPHAKWV